jgi:hypothetical protein
MPQLFLCRKNRVVQETRNGMGKSAVSSLVRMSTGSQLPVAVDLAGLLAHGWDTSVLTALVSMMVRKGRLGTSSLGVNIRGTTCLRELGGHALCGEGSDWLGSMTGPHTKEVWTGMYARLCSKALISFGRTHLYRV